MYNPQIMFFAIDRFRHTIASQAEGVEESGQALAPTLKRISTAVATKVGNSAQLANISDLRTAATQSTFSEPGSVASGFGSIDAGSVCGEQLASSIMENATEEVLQEGAQPDVQQSVFAMLAARICDYEPATFAALFIGFGVGVALTYCVCKAREASAQTASRQNASDAALVDFEQALHSAESVDLEAPIDSEASVDLSVTRVQQAGESTTEALIDQLDALSAEIESTLSEMPISSGRPLSDIESHYQPVSGENGLQDAATVGLEHVSLEELFELTCKVLEREFDALLQPESADEFQARMDDVVDQRPLLPSPNLSTSADTGSSQMINGVIADLESDLSPHETSRDLYDMA